MNNAKTDSPSLRAGEWVQVRTKEEILATLDSNGRLDELPFMPEMLQYCGKRMQVSKRAHKTCDPALGIGGRKMARTVHLGNIRCDGSAHDGCEAGCLIFWKDAWLKRVDGGNTVSAGTVQPDAKPQCTEETIRSAVNVPGSADESGPTYVCQNTQVKFATQPLAWWDVRQYVEDYTSGNVSLSQLAAGFLFSVVRALAEAGIGFGYAIRWTYDAFQRATGGSPYPLRPYGVVPGTPTPRLLLDLQEGEIVRVKPFREILKTLNADYRNRGMYFDAEMVLFSERSFKVSKRLKRIIDERTAKMVHFKSDAIVLDNVVCEARYAKCRRFCPRAIYPFWREIWLERVSPRGDRSSSHSPQSSSGNE
jgi:hypothetical protein